MAIPRVTPAQARRLLLRAQCLSGPAQGLRATLTQLGFVQLDSINTVARAQDLTLAARVPGYRLEGWQELVSSGHAFEHWTHDAAVIPREFRRYWQDRFRADGERMRSSNWWRERMGENFQELLDEIRVQFSRGERLRTSQVSPLRSPSASVGGGWWNWRPEKVALEYLWRSGELEVVARHHFHKVYARAEALPEGLERATIVDWACSSALERLGVATTKELSHYWQLVSRAEAEQWSRRGSYEAVLDAAGKPALAHPAWRERAQQWGPSNKLRLLAPFDPILRDRARALRLFGFDYRFEAFVPAAQRRFGYYTLPILDGERLVGRLTPRLDRRRGHLTVENLHWERAPSAACKARLDQAFERLKSFLGVSSADSPGNLT